MFERLRILRQTYYYEFVGPRPASAFSTTCTSLAMHGMVDTKQRLYASLQITTRLPFFSAKAKRVTLRRMQARGFRKLRRRRTVVLSATSSIMANRHGVAVVLDSEWNGVGVGGHTDEGGGDDGQARSCLGKRMVLLQSCTQGGCHYSFLRLSIDGDATSFACVWVRMHVARLPQGWGPGWLLQRLQQSPCLQGAQRSGWHPNAGEVLLTQVPQMLDARRTQLTQCLRCVRQLLLGQPRKQLVR